MPNTHLMNTYILTFSPKKILLKKKIYDIQDGGHNMAGQNYDARMTSKSKVITCKKYKC